MSTAVEQLQQKDNLCGPFWAARILRDAGFERWDGEEVDEDAIAFRAGTRLPEPDNGSVPPGAASRTGYRFELGTAAPEVSGTFVPPLIAAIEAASGGALRCVPIRGQWSAEAVERLVEVAPPARLLANVWTGGFWGSHPSAEQLIAELEGEQVGGPPPDWSVGHYCELVRVVRGRLGSLVLVHDSYAEFGWRGRHLQPPRCVAAALERRDGKEGGVIAVAPRAYAREVEAEARDLGLEIAVWDNGTRR